MKSFDTIESNGIDKALTQYCVDYKYTHLIYNKYKESLASVQFHAKTIFYREVVLDKETQCYPKPSQQLFFMYGTCDELLSPNAVAL